jgi:malic enzyme
VPEFKARAAIWLIDRRGLITTARKDLTPEKAQFAQASGWCCGGGAAA